jgi:hypothetical protein
MDGVLTDFDSGFEKVSGGISPQSYEKQHGLSNFWNLILNQPDQGIEWWSSLPKFKDTDFLWKYINSLGYPVKILSSTSSRKSKSNAAEIGKRKWLATNLNPTPKDDNVILVDSASLKKTYAKGPDHILIDDYSKNIAQWRSEGGIGIQHTSTSDTISQLKRILGVTDESYGYSWSNV